MLRLTSQVVTLISVGVLAACGSPTKSTNSTAHLEDKIAAINTLNKTIRPAVDAVSESTTEIDWDAGVLPWDRFTLPSFSPDGLHAAVQLGTSPSLQILSGDQNNPRPSTTIELHILDPIQGRRISPLLVSRKGLILSHSANDNIVLAEFPNGELGRWIAQIEWATGNVHWVVSDENINAFPTLNSIGDIAWSSRSQGDNRFHLVVQTVLGRRSIDDGKSDWILPSFLGDDRLRVFRITDGSLHLVELDLRTRDPLLTAIALPIVEAGATRTLAWQLAAANQPTYWHQTHAFYHPLFHRMAIWKPNDKPELVPLAQGSVAATPALDNTWLVATENRIVRQALGEDEGVHLRNAFAIPFATTSNQWTHLMLIPEGSRLQVRAINLDN